jgi:hypothetical protein
MIPSSSTFSSSRPGSEDLRSLCGWTFTVIARFLPLFVVAFGIVWSARPSSANPGLEDRIAGTLLAGHEVTGLKQWDPRLVQRRFIRGLRDRKDVVVLASSRGWLIRGSSFPEQSFFNSSVPLADLEDFLAIYAMYHRAGVPPAVVVLGIDPWMFSESMTNELWRSVAPEFDDGVRLIRSRGLSVPPGAFRGSAAVPAWFNLAIIRQSVATLLVRRSARSPSGELGDFPGVTQLPDGSLKATARGINPAARTVAIESVGDDGVFLPLTAFPRVGPGRLQLFESMVKLMQADGVSVRLFLSPFHPAVWQAIQHDGRYRSVAAVERALLEAARRLEISVSGSYDPAFCGVDEHEFGDAVHIKGPATNHVLITCLRRFES